jgi:hypothetical protein
MPFVLGAGSRQARRHAVRVAIPPRTPARRAPCRCNRLPKPRKTRGADSPALVAFALHDEFRGDPWLSALSGAAGSVPVVVDAICDLRPAESRGADGSVGTRPHSRTGGECGQRHSDNAAHRALGRHRPDHEVASAHHRPRAESAPCRPRPLYDSGLGRYPEPACHSVIAMNKGYRC